MLLPIVALMAMAQGKLTPQAHLAISHQQDNAQRQALARGGEAASTAMITLVVKIDGQNVAQTVGQIKAAGATVRSALGHQATISLPIDSVAALERIDGVVRIDKGHKGEKKSDVTRQATAVSQLNGPTATDMAQQYTGQGVNIIVADDGIDFQHPAFKDAEGRSRIKCVYLPGNDEGQPFTVNDPEWGEYTMPGSVFDTPELIATLTTDDEEEYHGTHTIGIAAGTLSPQGFGGMAPEADIVVVPFGFADEDSYEEGEECIEEILAFAAAYARQSGLPTVFSLSANSHAGPHDGTSSVTEAVEEASQVLIPVLSVGNEGGDPVHIYQKFTTTTTSIKTFLLGLWEDPSGEFTYLNQSEVVGYTRAGTEVSIQLSLRSINLLTGRVKTVWTSDKVTATSGGEETTIMVSSDDVPALSERFQGDIGLVATDLGNGKLAVTAFVDGGQKSSSSSICLFTLTVSGADGTEIDLWDNSGGFGGTDFIGLAGYTDGDSNMSAGDWTSTERVISVGAYCANTTLRNMDGTTEDTSQSTDPDDEVYVLDDIAWFSSFGTSFNGINQPVVCAPGVNIVSAYNHYCVADDADESMLWQGYPYYAESGTSMACPAVAGIIALWLQADPTLNIDGIRNVMAQSTVNDDFTAHDAIRWGYGKINATRGIEYITEQLVTGIHDQPANALYPQPSAVYDLQGRRVDGRPAPGLYVKDGRKTVIR